MSESGEEFDAAYWPKKGRRAAAKSRVMLFVQTGAGRPKCVARLAAGLRTDYYAEAVHFKNGMVAWPLARQSWSSAVADRWWLVECENAEAGRALIAAKRSWRGDLLDKSGPVLVALPSGQLTEGRILASGGQSDD